MDVTPTADYLEARRHFNSWQSNSNSGYYHSSTTVSWTYARWNICSSTKTNSCDCRSAISSEIVWVEATLETMSRRATFEAMRGNTGRTYR